jgi:methyl-accepting chemotaxis protein
MTDDELKKLFEANASETRELATEMRGTAAEMRESVVDLRRHFDVAVEHMDTRFDRLAESVALVNEKLDREAADIRVEMRRGFADTQAMIKFSHAELD